MRRGHLRRAGTGLHLGQVFLIRGQIGLRRGHLSRVRRFQQFVQLGLATGQVQLGLHDGPLQIGGVHSYQQVVDSHLIPYLNGNLSDNAIHL